MKQLDYCIEVSQNDIKNFSIFLLERENAEATVKKYVADIRTFFRYLNGNMQIDKKVLMGYKEWLVEKYAINSVNSMLAALNQFLEFIGIGTLKVKRIKIQKTAFIQERREMTEQEYRKLLNAAIEEGKEQLALCIETIACTGIRISEIRYFTVERIKTGKIEIYNKGKYRRIFLPKSLKEKILLYCQKHQIKGGWVFRTRGGKLKDRSNIWREMKNLKEKAGIAASKIFPHNLRHLFARVYYSFTKDITGLADLLGHSSINVTRIYTAATESFFQKQMDRIFEDKFMRITT